MKDKFALFRRSFLVVLLLPVFYGATASAWNPFSDVPCNSNGSGQSAVCQDRNNGNKNPLTGNDGIIMKAIDILALVAGVAAVIIILLAGLRYIQAGGNAEDIASARRSITYALVGLVVIVLSRALLALVLNKI